MAAETWGKEISKDRSNHIFISPKLNNPIEVLVILCHELVHVHLNAAGGHRHEFQQVAAAVGLQAPWVSATPTRELLDTVQEWCKELGTYPHAGFREKSKFYGAKSVGHSRKIICPSCGFFARTSLKWIKKGLPTCACGTEMIESKNDN